MTAASARRPREGAGGVGGSRREMRFQMATAMAMAAKATKTPRQPITGIRAATGMVAAMPPRPPMRRPKPVTEASWVRENHWLLPFIMPVRPAATPMPVTRRARTKPVMPSAAAKRRKPTAAVRPMPVCTRRGP